MAGKRQHFIPQLLLRRFADAQDGVWVGRLNGAVHGSKVDGVALEGMFYGPPGPGTADQSITDDELQIDALLARVAEAPAGPYDSREAAILISHFTTRTRAMRLYLEDMGRLAIGKISQTLGDPKEVERMVHDHLFGTTDVIAEELDALVLRQEGPVRLAVFRGSPVRAWAIHHARCRVPQELQKMMPGVVAAGAGFVDALSEKLVTTVKGAHSKAALQAPTPQARVDAYAAYSFAIEDHAPLLLGDSVAWCIRPGIGCCPLFNLEDDIECVVMPVGKTRVLHGWKSSRRLLTAESINMCSAVASREFVLASSDGPGVKGFIEHIGKGTAAALDEWVTHDLP